MDHFRTEGIILQSLNFRDYDRILTVYTTEEGLIKLIVKGINRPGKQLAGTPLTCAEFIYTKGNSDLYKCIELSSLNPLLKLRQSLETLESASDSVQAILKSQMPQVSAPMLYQLLLWTLNQIPNVKDPHLLSTSFRLKLLRHEGLLNINYFCTQCSMALEVLHLSSGESFCSQHAPEHHLSFNEEELLTIEKLTFLSSLAEAAEMRISIRTREKILQLFHDCFNC